MGSIFRDFIRTDSSPSGNSESYLAFLNRVNSPFWAAVRHTIQSWIDNVPSDHQSDLVKRLKSDDEHFHGAFWELYLHQVLRSSGYELQLHPDAPSGFHPDFFAKHRDGGTGFFLEARIMGYSQDVMGADRRLGQVLDALNAMTSPYYLLRILVGRVGPNSLGTEPLVGHISDWLNRLRAADGNNLPHRHGKGKKGSTWYETGRTLCWAQLGWSFEVGAVEKSTQMMASEGRRTVGMWSPPNANTSDDDVAGLRRQLYRKGSRYGNLDQPYVVALRSIRFPFSHGVMAEVLYGDSEGYFRAKGEWNHTHVSAVLAAEELYPHNVGEAHLVPTLWEHPAASKQLPSLPFWRRACVTDGVVEFTDPSIAPSDYLDLPDILYNLDLRSER